MLKEQIDEFLAQKQIGIVGISRNAAKFSNKVHEKLKESGHGVHPVHPEAESLCGDKCVRSIRELPGDVQALMLIASPDVCAEVLKDVAGTSINRVWVFAGPGPKSDVEAELRRLSDSGVSVIFGLCPFMFLEPVGSVHAVHRFFMRLFGKYPR